MSALALRLLLVLLLTTARLLAASASVVILHTNDLHDHVRSGGADEGGLPWIAGYVAKVRAERSDVVLFDAGDVTEKGDMVASKTDGVITYEAMRRMRYDVVTLGNHDFDPAFRDARAYEKALGQQIVSVNLRRDDGSPAFPASRVITVGALKIGVIGATVVQPTNSLDFAATGRAIAAEAERLRSNVHLIVAVCHDGSKSCALWSKMAPMVDVFVSGHSHELLPHPVIVPETGARIVQTGCYARRIGRLELVVDLDAKKITSARDEMVSLPHATTPVDREMLAWVQAREKELCPEASEIVFKGNPDQLTHAQIAWLAAEALRRKTKADIAFCSAERIVRSPLFPGDLDLNALFVATELGRAIVLAELTGAEIEAYLNTLEARDGVQTNWSGCSATRSGKSQWRTNLVASQRYRVAMTKLEWHSRFVRGVQGEKAAGAKRDHPLLQRTFSVTPVEGDVPTALAEYVKTVGAAGVTLAQRGKELADLAHKKS